MTNIFCRVCGYRHSEPQWGEDGKSPNYEICPCCGVESGNEDYTIESIRRYRKSWIEEQGSKWFYPGKPSNWSLDDQLTNIPHEFW